MSGYCNGGCGRVLIELDLEDVVVLGGVVFCVECGEDARERQEREEARELDSALDPESYRGPDGELGAAWDQAERRGL